MRVALVAHALPQPSSNGGPMTCWTILRELLDQGHDVTAVALHYPNDPFHSAEREDALRAEGAEVVSVPVGPEAQLDSPAGAVPLRGRPPLERVFPALRLRTRVGDALEEARPDAVLVYHWEALAATHAWSGTPRFGIVDDLWHLPNLRRWQHTRPSPTRAWVYWTLSTLRGLRPTRAAMGELLGACEAAGSFQAETAAALGVPYYPAPLPDPGSPGPHARNEKFRILLGPSHLGATSTRAGLVTFAREILPALERELRAHAFEVRIVGEGEPPPELVHPHPSVTLTGRIEPADDEFRSADVQLVPTPFALGKRVRIIAGWSFGCPVVAHRAEAGPLPELRDGENALFAGHGRGLAEALARLARDEPLRRRIAEGGRRTYEETFAPEVAARPIAERLVELAGRPVRAAH